MISLRWYRQERPKGSRYGAHALRPSAHAKAGPDPGAAPAGRCPGQPLPLKSRPAKPQMMRQYDLIERVRRYNPNTNEALLNRAYVYAMKAHGEQRRASGDPYFSHPIEVAAILTDLKLDDATIAAALLHDTIEDTEATRAEIDSLFGRDIGTLVEGLTKLKKLDLVTKEAKQAENLRKLLLAIADDVRVLLIKLADRLHNMRTLGYMPPEARRRAAEETLEIYAPLAGRMGMHEMREELDDLAFRELYPGSLRGCDGAAECADRAQQAADLGDRKAAHQETCRSRHRCARRRAAQARLFDLAQDGAQVGRVRAAVGYFRLSRARGDIAPIATRRSASCTRTWPMVPGRFKDYISTPKQNDYRSIHTTVIGPGKQRVELQIRTVEMHEIAEYGIAAHALYKDGVGSPTDAVARNRAPMPGCAERSSCWRKAPIRRNSSSTPSSSCSTTRCFASRPRAS